MTAALSRDLATEAAERLRAFAQPQRLMILSILVDRELAVGAIDAETAIGQPALSQQFAELRRAGLVTTRRDAKQVLYRLADDRTAAVVRFVAAVFGRDAAPHDALTPAPAPRPTRPVRRRCSRWPSDSRRSAPFGTMACRPLAIEFS